MGTGTMNTELFKNAFPFWESLTEAQRAEIVNKESRDRKQYNKEFM